MGRQPLDKNGIVHLGIRLGKPLFIRLLKARMVTGHKDNSEYVRDCIKRCSDEDLEKGEKK